MRKRIETYIPKAIEAVKTCGIAKNGEVPRQFNGYISSFAASVRQAGLAPTVLFFTAQTDRTEETRGKIVKAIEAILGQSILDRNNGRQNPAVTRDMVEDAATALKLAIRTFKLVDNKE
ncbi:type III-B CRISPR module-associated protein Cmr5 [Hydrogenimonas sp.]